MSFRRPPLAVLVAALAAVALVVALGILRDRSERLRGDESTYVAMAASLARDGDLLFGAADEAWARSRPDRPAAVILQRSARGVAYSKPILYPLLAAPFWAVGGRTGLQALNLLAVALALLLAAAALARRAGGERSVETVLLFACGSTVLPYVAWAMSESLQVALATAGLALALASELPGRPADNARRGRFARWVDAPAAPWVGAALLGLLVALREPNGIVAAVPPVVVLLGRRPRRALGLAAVSAASYAAVTLLAVALTGAPNAYKAPRSTFNAEIGYPGAESPEVSARFDSNDSLATSSLELVPESDARRSAYAAVYFLVGRHSGLIAYFPALLALLGAAVLSRDRVGRVALAGLAGLSAFYLIYWPVNYFGGETAIGNRYLLAAYPCALFAAARLPGRRLAAAAWLLAFVAGGSALASTLATRDLDPTSQTHVHAGLFRALPYESTASNVEGRRDRYWNGDFVRFVDPWARVDRWSFELIAGEPAAELEIATAWDGTPEHWLVVADAPEAALVLSDWRRSERLELARRDGGRAGGPFLWRPGPAWRRHRFWFGQGALFDTRLVRLRLDAPEGTRARVRYLGRTGVPGSIFDREVVAVGLPETAVAGAPARVPVSVVARGGLGWSSQRPLPVLLAVAWAGLDGGPSGEARKELPGEVRPGERLDAEIAFDWPERPGRYRIRVDLVLEDVTWFGARAGAPLADAIVSVVPPEAPGAPPAPSRR